MNHYHSYTLLASTDQAWSTLLQEYLAQNGFAPVCRVQTGDAVLNLLSQVVPRLVLLDLCLPGSGVVELCTEIRRVQPAVKVILLTDHADEAPVALFDGRVAGCINRQVALAAWPGLLTYTLSGGTVFGGNLLGAFLVKTQRAQKQRLERYKVRFLYPG